MPFDGTKKLIGRDAFLYMEPPEDASDEEKNAFAQCGTCRAFQPRKLRCAKFKDDREIVAGGSCGRYDFGTPSDKADLFTPDTTSEKAGYVVRQVRCENCRYGGARCGWYEELNAKFPDEIYCEPKIKPKACCNAQEPKEREGHAEGGRIGYQVGGEIDDWVTPSPPSATPHQNVDDWVTPPPQETEQPSLLGEVGRGAMRAGTQALYGIHEAANWIENKLGEWTDNDSIKKTAAQDIAEVALREKAAQEAYKPSVGTLGEAAKSPKAAAHYAAGIVGAALPTIAQYELLGIPRMIALGAFEGAQRAAKENNGDPLATTTGAFIGGAEAGAPVPFLQGAVGKGLLQGAVRGALGMGAYGAAQAALEPLPKAAATGVYTPPTGSEIAENIAGGVIGGGLFGGYGALRHRGAEEAAPAGRQPAAAVQAQPATAQPALPPEVAAIPAPPIGTTVNLTYPEGVRAATIVAHPQPGMAEIEHADGSKELIANADLEAKKAAPPPEAAPTVAPTPVAPAPAAAAAAVPPPEVRPEPAPTPVEPELPADPLHDLWQASEQAHEAAATEQPLENVGERIETAAAELEKQAEPAEMTLEEQAAHTSDRIGRLKNNLDTETDEFQKNNIRGAIAREEANLGRLEDSIKKQAEPEEVPTVEPEKAAAVEPEKVKEAPPTASESPVPAPGWLQERTDQDFATAQRLGIVDDIERLAAQGNTARQIVRSLKDRFPAGISKMEFDPVDVVRAVRNKLDIPSLDERGEFAAWQSAYNQRLRAAAQAAQAPQAPTEPKLTGRAAIEAFYAPGPRVPLEGEIPAQPRKSTLTVAPEQERPKQKFTDELKSAMRQADALGQEEWQRASDLRAPSGAIGVGAADFDHVLRATLADSYLKSIRNGGSPDEAYEAAKQEGAAAVEKHNSRRPEDVNWQRSPESQRPFLDRIDRIIRPAAAPPEPTSTLTVAPEQAQQAEAAGRDVSQARLSEARNVSQFSGPTVAERFPHRNTLDDAQRLRDAGSYPDDLAGGHAAARDYVFIEGTNTGREFFATNDGTGRIVAAGTSGLPDAIGFSDEMLRRIWDPNAIPEAVHHNHPSNFPLSIEDTMALAAPGIGSVTAHGHDGAISSASLTPAARGALLKLPPAERQQRIKDMALGAQLIARDAIDPIFQRGMLPTQRAHEILFEAQNRLLAANGITDYVSTRTLPSWTVSRLIQSLPKLPNTGDIGDRLNRSAGPLRPEDAMARISETHGELSAGRPASAGGVGAGEARPGVAAGEPEPTTFASRLSLAEGTLADRLREHLAGEPRPAEPADPDAHVAADALSAAGDPRGPGSFDRLRADTGLTPTRMADPSHRNFAVFQRQVTVPMTAGRRDEIQNAKWQVINSLRKDRAALFHESTDRLQSWRDAPAESWRRVLAAAEIATLQNKEIPLDGRRVIVRNDDHPFAELSKPGTPSALVALSPEETKMFADLRGAFDKTWQNLVTETARRASAAVRRGEIEPTGAALYKAAEEAGPETREGARLKRAAAIVAAIEAKHRTSYLPLMRKGDYFFRVTPHKDTEAKVGIPGWDGDGMPPTAMFRLIDSERWYERLAGGLRQGLTKNAQAELERLQGIFPPAEYHIEHGYLFDNPDTIRNLNMPAVDKLMTMVSTDAKGILESSNRTAGMDRAPAREKAQADWKKMRDEIIDKIYEEAQAKFKEPRREIPGYDGNFAESLGRYFHWLASHTANLRYADAMDKADDAIAHHPDPKTRAYWRDYDRDQDDYGDQELYGPLARLRQANFYMMLGGNMASTAKIMLHGVFLGMPLLSTGLDRGAVAATYLNAFRQLATPFRGLKPTRNGIESDLSVGALDEGERALLRNAEAEGIVHPQGFEELGGLRHGGFENLTPTQQRLRRFFDIWGSNISAADRTVRGAQLLAAYRTANRVGMDKINSVWDRDINWKNAPEKTPEAFAKFMVDRAAGIWGGVNRLPLFRSQLGQNVAQYRFYEMNYLSVLNQMLKHMGTEGKMTAALMMGGMFAIGGALALPFSQNLIGAANVAWKWATDVDPNFQDTLKDMMNSGWFDGAGDIVMHGAARKLFGIDWGSIGFGDILSRNLNSPLDLFGAAISSTVHWYARAVEHVTPEQKQGATRNNLRLT